MDDPRVRRVSTTRTRAIEIAPRTPFVSYLWPTDEHPATAGEGDFNEQVTALGLLHPIPQRDAGGSIERIGVGAAEGTRG